MSVKSLWHIILIIQKVNFWLERRPERPRTWSKQGSKEHDERIFTKEKKLERQKIHCQLRVVLVENQTTTILEFLRIVAIRERNAVANRREDIARTKSVFVSLLQIFIIVCKLRKANDICISSDDLVYRIWWTKDGQRAGTRHKQP